MNDPNRVGRAYLAGWKAGQSWRCDDLDSPYDGTDDEVEIAWTKGCLAGYKAWETAIEYVVKRYGFKRVLTTKDLE